MKLISFLFTALSIFLLQGCGEDNKKSINIAVASNVSYAIEEIKEEFLKLYPEISLSVTVGSSGKLSAQIEQNAPYQIFMSANMFYPERLYKNGFAVTEPTVYAEGQIALLTVKSEVDLTRDLEDILKGISKIAVANPKTAPYGKATVEALKTLNSFSSIKEKFVYGDSISQTLSYVLNATDLGFVAKSSLYSPKLAHLKEGINWISVESSLYQPIKQGVVILKKGDEEAKKFYNFLTSEAGKDIFRRYGYLLN